MPPRRCCDWLSAITPGGVASRNQMPFPREPECMATNFDRSKWSGGPRRDGIGASRWIALGAVTFFATLAFAYFRSETGSAALAISGASLLSVLMLLPLRCQLDPCHR